MKKLIKIAREYELKLCRIKLAKECADKLLEKAFADNENEDLEVLYNDQHFGWYVWDPVEQKHIKKDLNDFDEDEEIEDVKEFIHSLKDVRLEDYK
jgi:hypothetical protein